REIGQRNAVIAEAERSSFFGFRSHECVLAPQINYRFDSEPLQRLQTAALWLRTAIEMRIDLMKVGQLRILSLCLSERVKGERDHQRSHNNDGRIQSSQMQTWLLLITDDHSLYGRR